MSHQYVTNNFPTLERLALVRLREQFPGPKRKGLLKSYSQSLRRRTCGAGKNHPR
jgi:hypothetical protein